ncbi:lpcat1 [Symbiodinium sp. CCMP2592]|nr:lpcat1 [Symbiodinium sp. CCMP2592]
MGFRHSAWCTWLYANGIWPTILCESGPYGNDFGPLPSDPEVRQRMLRATPLIVSNHVSYLDTVVLPWVLEVPKLVAMAEVASWPLFGQLCQELEMIWVDRSNPESRRAAKVDACIGLQKRIFPVQPTARTMLVSVPPNWKRALLVVPLQSLLDVLWYGAWYYFNDSGVYPQEYWDRVVPWLAPFAWIPMGLAVSMGEPKNLREALGFGAWIGFITFAIYAGVELTFDPEAIANHATEWQRGERPLLIWPEGTTSNGQGIKDFKHGAFLPGVPVRPVLIKYTGDWDPSNVSFRDAQGEMKPAEAYGDRQWLEQFLGHMLHSCTVLICKPYTPSEEEKANPELFKANVHKLMSERLNELNDYTERQRESKGAGIPKGLKQVGGALFGNVEAFLQSAQHRLSEKSEEVQTSIPWLQKLTTRLRPKTDGYIA